MGKNPPTPSINNKKDKQKTKTKQHTKQKQTTQKRKSGVEKVGRRGRDSHHLGWNQSMAHEEPELDNGQCLQVSKSEIKKKEQLLILVYYC